MEEAAADGFMDEVGVRMRVQVQDRQWSKVADKNQIDICVI